MQAGVFEQKVGGLDAYVVSTVVLAHKAVQHLERATGQTLKVRVILDNV